MRSPMLSGSEIRVLGVITGAVSIAAIIGIAWLASRIQLGDFAIDPSDYDGD